MGYEFGATVAAVAKHFESKRVLARGSRVAIAKGGAAPSSADVESASDKADKLSEAQTKM